MIIEFAVAALTFGAIRARLKRRAPQTEHEPRALRLLEKLNPPRRIIHRRLFGIDWYIDVDAVERASADDEDHYPYVRPDGHHVLDGCGPDGCPPYPSTRRSR